MTSSSGGKLSAASNSNNSSNAAKTTTSSVPTTPSNKDNAVKGSGSSNQSAKSTGNKQAATAEMGGRGASLGFSPAGSFLTTNNNSPRFPSTASTMVTSTQLSSAGGARNYGDAAVTTNSAPASHPEQRTVGTVTSTSDIGVMTEPDALGPCEPGTSVHLDGIVWHESDTGK